MSAAGNSGKCANGYCAERRRTEPVMKKCAYRMLRVCRREIRAIRRQMRVSLRLSHDSSIFLFFRFCFESALKNALFSAIRPALSFTYLFSLAYEA